MRPRHLSLRARVVGSTAGALAAHASGETVGGGGGARAVERPASWAVAEARQRRHRQAPRQPSARSTKHALLDLSS